MIAADLKENELSDSKNALEEYIYDMRSRVVDGELIPYVDDRQRTKFLAELQTAETWLKNERTDQKTETFVDRLKSLKVNRKELFFSFRNVFLIQNTGDPIRQRHYEAENRSRVLQEFGKTLQKIDETLKSLQTKCVNSDRNEIEKVQKMLEEKTKFYKQTEIKFRTVRPLEDAPVSCAQIQREQEVRQRFFFPQ